MRIIEVDYGVANTYHSKGYTIIEINKHLQEFPELREKVINHELEHAKTKNFWKNRKIDSQTNVTFKDLFPFYKKYPKTLLFQYSPITYKDNTLYFEWSLIFIYTSWILLGTFVVFIINSFSNDWSFIFKVIQYMLLIGAISVGVLIGWKKLIKSINEEAKKTESKGKKTDLEKLETLKD